MSERLPYEEMDRQFNDLLLPDEEASWQKMKELLDEDDDEVVPTPFFLRSCLGWAVLLLVGLTIAWLVIRPEKWWNENDKTNSTSSVKIGEKNIDKTNSLERKNTTTIPANEKDGKEINTPLKQKETNSFVKQSIMQSERKRVSIEIALKAQKKSKKENLQEVLRRTKQFEEPINIVADNKVTGNQKDKDKNSDTSSAITDQPQDSKPVDSVKAENITQPNDTAIQKEKIKQQKKLFLTAGIGEQQQIPIAGQTAVPYSHYGRKGSLSDYVPSVFVQLQKEKKWFVQGEFRYGAPQSVKEFSFNRKTRLDTFTNNITITTQCLKKTYYHQMPLSFNYYVLPNLSIGVGGIYSRFFGAITEREITTYNTLTQTVSNVKQIIPIRHFTDSFLYKTQVHALLQADYQWRRFALGLRYTKDIQPYIKYTKPDGTVDEEKNQSLQFIVRYRLWQSKKF